MILLPRKSNTNKEVKKTSNKNGKNLNSEMILEYYKDWNSDNTPVMMMLDLSDAYPGRVESEDEKKMSYLRVKYGKMPK